MASPAIQLDMFEVQLGAALLITFSTDGHIVRVLADAGVKAKNYKREHVLEKLHKIFGDSERRIDLIIGTHYDEDHLNGLVPIIADESISIGEAWMPPVANDVVGFPVDTRVATSDLLTSYFGGEGGAGALLSYLKAKQNDIKSIQAIADELDNRNASGTDGVKANAYAYVIPEDHDDKLPTEEFFRRELDECVDDCNHGLDLEFESDPLVDVLIQEVRTGKSLTWHPFREESTSALVARAKFLNQEQSGIKSAQLASLANLRKGAAKDAINAKALHEVIQALEKRNIPVRSEIVEDGTPRVYGWDRVHQRFVPTRPPVQDIGFTLLGPSRSLVKKHRDRLPVMESAKVALMFRGEIRSITPSNQLSYIGCFGFQGQNILISGDAGCVDFGLDRNTYHQALLDAMSPLHVIQVAHHGGNNAHFYRVLAAANFSDQKANSYLLLSHATHDKKRPSDLFREFLLSTLGKGDDVKLLFTSEPSASKIADFKKSIFKAVGNTAKVGDIGLEYVGGNWAVTKHAISIDD